MTGAPAGVNVSGKTAPHAPVAIVVRTRNRPVLLARALDSVLGQTYEDYVVVVVNDDGDRPSVEQAIAKAADRASGRIHLVHNAVSRGREAAMNTGLSASSSTYVVIHDDDDTWAPTYLDRTVAHLERTGQQGVATRAEVVFERIDGDLIVVEDREILASDKHEVTLL
ncbi:MAG TPA: glycosyltransferase family 2 protein, partial [Nakamurella sp.]